MLCQCPFPEFVSKLPDATRPSVTCGLLPVSEKEEDPEDQGEGALRKKPRCGQFCHPAISESCPVARRKKDMDAAMHEAHEAKKKTLEQDRRE